MQRPGASGGPGGGSRTRKSFRPETCEVSAFTSFATPAPHRLRTLVRPKAETPDLARAAVPRRKICWELFLPHRIPVAPQLPRQHPLHPLCLRTGQRIELGVQIGPQPQPVLPHVAIVLHAVLVALEPRRGVEPRHPHIQRRLPGVMTGIGGAELGMLEHGGIELDHIDVVSRHLLRHADQSSSGRPRNRYFDGGWNSTSRRQRMTKGRLGTPPSFVVGLWGVRYQVTDVARSVAFYTKDLGFELDRQNLPAFAQVSIGQLKLILSGPGASGSRLLPDGRRQEPGGWNRVVLQVRDLPARIAELQEGGLKFRNEMEVGPGGKQIQLEDPDGNPIELFEPVGQ